MFNTFSEKWNSLLGKPSVRIRFHHGKTTVVAGKILSSKTNKIGLLLSKHGCKSAWIHYYSPSHSRSFTFSKNIPNNLQQRIRNLWLS